MLRSIRSYLRARGRGELLLVPGAALGVVLAVTAVGTARAVPRQRAATARLTFVDLASDKVGQGTRATPDGAKDGHMQLVVNGTGTIDSITLQTADATGKACCGQVWNTVPNDSLWILGAFRDGKQLNPTDRAVSIPVNGSVTLDLYATNTGRFKIGQRFVADVAFAGGETATSASAPITTLSTTPGGGGGGGGGGTTTTTTTTTTPAPGPASPPAATTTGTVTVNGRPFTTGTIPFNATVDVTSGRIVLTSNVGTLTVTGAGGVTAAFKLVRGRDKGKPVVELRLVKGDFKPCKKPRAARANAAAAKIVRQVWGDGKGSFRTRGRYASATVRGTRWLTSDRCDGTNVKVARGVIQVADFPQRRQVTVRAGRSYLARP